MTTKLVAEVLGVTEKDVNRAVRVLGNVGTKTHRQGSVFTSDDIDRIKKYLGV